VLKALIIDHFDSFTWNIKSWLERRFNVDVVSYNDIDILNASQYQFIVISPGPKSPFDFPKTSIFLQNCPPHQAILGICLGMQIMTITEGGSTETYSPPYHGKTSSLIFLTKSENIRILKDIKVARYHSIKCQPSNQFEILAQTNDDAVDMIIRHKYKNWLGFQFHPESFLTTQSEDLLQFIIKELNL